MKSLMLTTILICVIMSESNAVPNILKNTWNVLTKFESSNSKCPDLEEPPYTVNIPHESDCGKFYICQKGKKIEMRCPSILEFNAEIKLCDWPRNANCLLEKNNALYIGMEELDSKTTKTTTVGNRKLECVDEDQHIPHESRCDQYYRCVYGRKILKICPDDMVFNRELGTCDFRYNVLCGSLTAAARDEKRDVAYLNFLDDYVDNKISPEKPEMDYDYHDDFFEQDFYESPAEARSPINKCPEETNFYAEPVLFPHEEKCNAYYRCSRGKKQLMFCPGMLRFNPQFSVCDWPNKVKCKKRKLPTTTRSSVDKMESNKCRHSACQDSTVYLPDLEDPRKFIRCENGKEIREYCPNGLIFDAKLRVCNLAS